VLERPFPQVDIQELNSIIEQLFAQVFLNYQRYRGTEKDEGYAGIQESPNTMGNKSNSYYLLF